MSAYRIYIVSYGPNKEPPHVIECADDQEALGKAVQYVNVNAVELWQGPRLVVRFPSEAAT
jgi:hypothetical protein